MSDEFPNDASTLREEATRPPPEDRAAFYRQRATDLLDTVTSRAKDVLAERGVTFDIFLLVPRSGNAIVLFGSALPSFVDSTPRAYRLKAGNADLPIQHWTGHPRGERPPD